MTAMATAREMSAQLDLSQSTQRRDAMHGRSLKDARPYECDLHITNLWRLRDAEALDHTPRAASDPRMQTVPPLHGRDSKSCCM